MSEQLELDFREWRPIKDYEGLYKISSDGLVYSYPRPRTSGGYTYGKISKNKHCQVVLSKNGKIKSMLVHRLVWEAFVGDIPKGYDIHHKNHNPIDNRLENLEIIETSKHIKLHNRDRIEKTMKPVVQYTLDGEFVAEYESTSEAGRQTGIPQTNISSCCIGKLKTAGGSIWKYAS